MFRAKLKVGKTYENLRYTQMEVGLKVVIVVVGGCLCKYVLSLSSPEVPGC